MTAITAETNGPGVAEVDAAVRAAIAAFLPSPSPGPRAASASTGAEIFNGRLLSLRVAESIGAGAGRVVVGPGTVVTPLARDHLKRLGVEVRVGSTDLGDGRRREGEWGFLVDSRSGLIEAIRRGLLDGPSPWREVPGAISDTYEWVAGSADRGALVLTDEAPVVVYRACQVPGVRAAEAVDVEGASRAVRSLGANLLAVEPTGKPIGLVRQIGAAFRRAGGPVAPDWWAEKNGGRR